MKKEKESIAILGRIFGSENKVKIMRLFLFEQNTAFDMEDITNRSKVRKDQARKEINNLEKAGLLKKKTFTKDVYKGKGKNKKKTKKKTKGWMVNEKFPYIKPLQHFLIHINPLKHDDILKRLSKVGKIKLLLVAGVFIQEIGSRVDLLIVGDNLNEIKIKNSVKEIEAEIGKELKYSVFATDDFEYRHGMYDKLIRDILDFPHEKVIDKLDVR